jgi:hypothetical protein
VLLVIYDIVRTYLTTTDVATGQKLYEGYIFCCLIVLIGCDHKNSFDKNDPIAQSLQKKEFNT